jgi:hypothetical protein
MRIFVLFNLRAGVDPKEYEAWARDQDIPTVRALPSIAWFQVSACTGLLGSEGTPPYQYIEVIDVADMDRFGTDIGTDTMQAIAAAFRQFADDPVFITTRGVGVDP